MRFCFLKRFDGLLSHWRYYAFVRRIVRGNRGFTFIEVMVAVAILSLGIVMIFRGMLTSLDHMRYLTDRLYATTLLDNRIVKTERFLRAQHALPFELRAVDDVVIGPRRISFEQTFTVDDVEDFVDLFSFDVTVRWKERDRTIQLTRSAYIAEFGPGEYTGGEQ